MGVHITVESACLNNIAACCHFFVKFTSQGMNTKPDVLVVIELPPSVVRYSGMVTTI